MIADKPRRIEAHANGKPAPAAPEGKNGYILSLVVLVLMSVLAIFANDTTVQKQQAYTLLQKQFYTEKTVFIIDDMAQDMRSILSLDTPSNSTQLVFYENLAPAVNKSQFLANYSDFISNFSQFENANVSFAYSDPLSILLSNGLTYTSNFTNQQVDLYNATDGAAAVTAYYISINSSQASNNCVCPDMSDNSTLNWTFVYFNFTDLAKPQKSCNSSGYVNPNALTQFDIKYSSGHVYVNIGNISGRPNSYQAQQIGVTALSGHSLTVNLTSRSGLYAVYNLPLNITLPSVTFIDRLPVR